MATLTLPQADASPSSPKVPAGEFGTYDTGLTIHWSNPQREVSPCAWECFNRLCDVLRGVRFEIDRDPKMDAEYSCIAKYYRYGRRETPQGALELRAEVHPALARFGFYQNVVIENRNGGRYDFDKRQKMPYLVGKAFELSRACLVAKLSELGFQARHRSAPSPNPDPLAWFNHWDSEWDVKAGRHRFKRRPDGWPTDEEIFSGGHPGLDRDGVRLTVGCTRYFRDYDGHLLRGRCYPNMNNMWFVVYGPGQRDWTVKSAWEFFSCDPRQVKRRVYPGRKSRLEKLLRAAVDAQDFERAIVLRDVLKRDSAHLPEGGAA